MASKFAQAGAVLGVAGRSYKLWFFDFIELPGGPSQLAPQDYDPAAIPPVDHRISWDFGDGSPVEYGPGNPQTPLFHKWMSPGVFDVTVTYYVTTSATKKTTRFTVKMGFDVKTIWEGGGESDPYGERLPVVATFLKKTTLPGQSPRFGFIISPVLNTEARHDVYGEARFGEEEIDSFFNMCKEIERFHAGTIMRYPVPRSDELEEGLYGTFEHDVIYCGTSDRLRELQRKFADALSWDYTHETEDCCPYRVYDVIRELVYDIEDFPAIIHPYRPFELIFPEGNGLRLAREAILADLLDNTVSELTVRQQKALDTKREEQKNYSLLWMHDVIWPLSCIVWRYLKNVNVAERMDGMKTLALVVFNPEDLSLSVRIGVWKPDVDAYGNDHVSWRHVSTQVNFVATSDAEEVAAKFPLTPKRMYDDRTGDAVRVLPHDEAEQLVGQPVQADEKVISINGAYYLFSSSSRVLTPVGGGMPTGFGGGNLYAMMTTRGGGATLESSPMDDNPFLGNMVTVESWTSSKREATARWKGLARTPEENTLTVEGVDKDLLVLAKQGVDGETLKILPLSDFIGDDEAYAEAPEYICDIVLGPRDLGRYDAGGGQ